MAEQSGGERIGAAEQIELARRSLVANGAQLSFAGLLA
jgi:hypothetical protein